MTVMVAPGSAAPMASVIRPSMSPYVVWPDAVWQTPKRRRRTITARARNERKADGSVSRATRFMSSNAEDQRYLGGINWTKVLTIPSYRFLIAYRILAGTSVRWRVTPSQRNSTTARPTVLRSGAWRTTRRFRGSEPRNILARGGREDGHRVVPRLMTSPFVVDTIDRVGHGCVTPDSASEPRRLSYCRRPERRGRRATVTT